MLFFQIFLVVLIFRCSFAVQELIKYPSENALSATNQLIGRQTGESSDALYSFDGISSCSDRPHFLFSKLFVMQEQSKATAQAKNVHQSIRAEILKHFPNLKSIKVKKHHRAGRVLVLAKDEHKRHIKATGNYYNALVNFMGSQERVASYFTH
jgi:hypothetical protein